MQLQQNPYDFIFYLDKQTPIQLLEILQPQTLCVSRIKLIKNINVISFIQILNLVRSFDYYNITSHLCQYKYKIIKNFAEKMSFFPQTQRKQIFNVLKFKTPSPFQYKAHGLSKPVFGTAPFGSTAKLNRSVSTHQFKDRNKLVQNQLHVDNSAIFSNLADSVIKKQQKTSAFKSQTERFLQKDQIIPGPAQYTIKPLDKQIYSKKNYKNKSSSMHNFFINPQKLKVPSIPSDHLGYKQGKNNNMQKVVQSLNVQPELGAYQLRTQLLKKNGLQWKKVKEIKEKVQQLTPGPGDYQIKLQKETKANISSFKSTIQRFNLGDSKKEKRPGPGYYHPQNSHKKQVFQTKNDNHFNSKTSRFNWMNPTTNIGPGQYQNLDKEKSKSMIQFKKNNNDKYMILQSTLKQKKTIFDQKNLNPGPGQYANTLGMGFELQKSLIRKYTDSVFPKEKRQFFSIKKEQTLPGPGSYNYSQNQKSLNNTKKKGLYKKTQIINLKDGVDEIYPSPLDYANFNNTIQQKLNQSKNKLTLTESKPFGLGEQRFRHYLKFEAQNQNRIIQTQINDFSTKKVKRIVMTNVKVNIPFGSSCQKQSNKLEQRETLSQFYCPKQQWVKKSHNIKSKLDAGTKH